MKRLLLFITLIPFISNAQEELDPVTVTASLIQQNISKTGRNLIVIKGEQFARLPVNSVDELLRYVPGMEVQARGPMGSQSDIILRGGTFQQVLVILDGVRINDPNTGHFSSYIPIAPAEIERIEILKGASSAVYGSDAVGGVIHIITKTFAAQQDKTLTSLEIQQRVGEYELLGINAGGFHNNGKTSVGGGILSNSADGQPQRGIDGYFRNQTASLSVSQRISEKWFLAIRSSLDQRKFAAQNFYTTFASDTASEEVRTLWNQLAVFHTKKDHSLQISLGYKNLKDEFAFNSGSAPNRSTSNLFQGMITDSWKMKAGRTLVSGIQYLSRQIESNDRGEHELGQAAAFVVLNQEIGSRIHIAPALRVEHNKSYGLELVPQFNLSYRLHQFQLRASGGKTIRDPDFTERYNNYNKTLVTSGRIGNPNLEAERSLSYEAGADYFGKSGFRFSTTFFQRYHSKLIDYVVTPYSEMPRKENLSPTGTYALAKNISEITTTGAEADLHYAGKIAAGHIVSGSLGLIWLQSNSTDGIKSFYVSSHAKFLTNFSLQWSAPRFNVSVNGLYKTRESQAASAISAKVSSEYFVMNTRAEVSIIPKKLGVFVQVDNVLDTHYQDLLGSQMPGRWIAGGFRFSFQNDRQCLKHR